MKISIVGCGGISRTHIGAVRDIPDARIISVADCIPERAEAAAKQCGAKAYTSLEDMLAGEKPDVLHICTPHYLHVPMAVYAMERGVDVLCEKPCAMTESQLKELRECQRRTGRQFGVCFQNRYNRSVQYLKNIIDSKTYGELIGMRAFVTWKRDADYYASGDWRGKKATEGGGVMINQALHTLDILQWFMGMPDSVIANVSNNSLRGIIEVEDTAFGLFKYKNNPNKDFIINATNAAKYSFPVNISVSDGEHTVVIVGDNLIIDDKFVETEKGQPIFGKEVWGTGHINLIKDYYDCLERHKPFALDFFEARKVVKLILAMYGSDGAEKEIK